MTIFKIVIYVVHDLIIKIVIYVVHAVDFYDTPYHGSIFPTIVSSFFMPHPYIFPAFLDI